MARRIIKYLLIFFAMYFLGHFIMTMAYRFGKVPTIAIGIVSPIIVIFTFLKAAHPSEGKKEIFYGIFSGFFMWLFGGEFLEYMGMVKIVEPRFFPVLVAYVLIISFFIYKRYLPVGISFALGHFGCIWLVHSMGIYQAEILKFQHPQAYQILRTATGIIFFLTFLFLSFKLFKAKGEKAQIAYTLFAFIFLWSVVETFQLFHIIPDYTYYSYWAEKISPAKNVEAVLTERVSKAREAMGENRKDYPLPNQPSRDEFERQLEKKIESVKAKHTWESEKTKELAGFLLKSIPAPIVHDILDDFSSNLDKRLKEEKKEKIDEAMLCQVIEESIVNKMRATFNNTIKGYVQKFEDEKSVN